MTSHALNIRRVLTAIFASVTLTAIAPTGAVAATPTIHEKSPLGISVPASARVGGTTGPTTTPASGAQPGTVAPGATPTSTTPTTTAPPTATVPTTTVPTTTAPTTTTPGAPTTAIVAARKPTPAKGLSTGALILAIFGALLALGCIIWVASRWLALEPKWTVSAMHSLREASYHASATWAEFSDWARLGH